MSTIYIEIPEDLKQQLRVLAAMSRRTQADIVEEAIRQYMIRVPTVEPGVGVPGSDPVSGGR